MSAMEYDGLDARENTLYRPLGPREKPVYDALSYTWGGAEDPQSIVLNGSVHGVTANLGNALRHLRREEEDLTLWVDALCIDQKNNDEKSIQVCMMGDIYRRAACVRAWISMREDEDLRREEHSKSAANFKEPMWTIWSLLESLGTSKWVEFWGDGIGFLEGPDVAEMASSDLRTMAFVDLIHRRNEL
ncbi:hypothetical protein IFR05_003746 [Cadophora sp. M221]|nr:hypothetical protein IFR05_003746 [Cadophora sp. M221]